MKKEKDISLDLFFEMEKSFGKISVPPLNDMDGGSEEDLLQRQERIHTLARDKAEREFAHLLDGRDEDTYTKLLEAIIKAKKGTFDNIRNFIRVQLKKACLDSYEDKWKSYSLRAKEPDGYAAYLEKRKEAFHAVVKGLLGDKGSDRYFLKDPNGVEYGFDTVWCSRTELSVRGKVFLAGASGAGEDHPVQHLTNGLKYKMEYYWYNRRYGKDSRYVWVSSLEDELACDVSLRFLKDVVRRHVKVVLAMQEADRETHIEKLREAHKTELTQQERESLLIPDWEYRLYLRTGNGHAVWQKKGGNPADMPDDFDLRLRFFYETVLMGEISIDGFDEFFPYAKGKYSYDLDALIYSMTPQIKEAGAVFKSYSGARKGGDYAKSYQTKKGIPEKTKKLMKELSEKLFGFVEIDEDCDLDKVTTVFAEIDAFCKKYLPDFSLNNAAIRFRKLGNHKAVGLYYPFWNCLCVDIRCPSSFVHELGHLIDHQKGEGRLSDKPAFDRIRRLYKKNFNLEGKALTGKYDESYYLDATEIFARSFEVFISKRIKADICKPEDDLGAGFAYPTDESYVEAVEQYYSGLLEELGFAGQQLEAC